MAGAIDDAAVIYIQGLLDGPRVTQSKPTIFLVEDRLRNVNEKHYEPKKVSIGPIHRGKDQVKSMEEHKMRLLKELLVEKKDVITLKTLVEEVRKKEEDARRCYSSESINLKNDHDFLGTMILDGCFIIQLIRRYRSPESAADPILESNTLIQIMQDLLLFENQIPFFVLTSLFDKIKTGNSTDNLRDLIVFLVGDIIPWFDKSKVQLPPEPNHLLELVYRCISTKKPSKSNGGQGQTNLPSGGGKRQNDSPNGGGTGQTSPAEVKKKTPAPNIHINSASEIKEIGGIDLERSEDNILSFASKVLKLPPLQVSSETEPLLRNLMAYEQLQLGNDKRRHVIDYVFFMHCLAKSTKDIEILRYHGIIKNYLGGDEKILKMIGRLGTHFLISTDYTYSDTFESLNKLCSNRRNEWMAILQRTHFNTPWSTIKFGSGAFLLAVAALQLLFAVLTYVKKKH